MTRPDDGRGPRWSVVVPVKLLHLAKSRLAAPSSDDRRALALAMALDVAAAATACRNVALVLAVSDDPVAVPRLRALGVTVVPDVPDAGLNPALVHGAAVAADRQPGCGVAVLAADLPALEPVELAVVLDAAAAHERAVVADAAGTGTTLLTARARVALRPAYGEDSLRRHVASGAVPLDVPATSGLRRDVDTAADLEEAERLGLGPHTAAVLVRLRR